MKKWQLYLFTHIAMLVIGVLLTLYLTKKPQQPEFIPVPIPEVSWVTIYTDTTFNVTDTTFIKDSMEIKTKITTTKDSLLTYFNSQPYYQPFTISIVSDNFYEYRITETPRNIMVDTRQKVPSVKLYGNLAVSVNTKKVLCSEMELGLTFMGKMSTFIRIDINHEMNSNIMAGVKVWL